MAQTDMASTTSAARDGAGILTWIFRVLVVAGAAFMLYSWFQPWWSADIAIIPGTTDMVLHPWGADAAAMVRSNMDESAFQMPYPQVFAGFMWVYLVVCMLALLVSLFWKGRLRLGPINLPWAMVFILVVGLSYAIAAGVAYEIGTLKAAASGINFVGKSTFTEQTSGAKIKMTSGLLLGYWLAIAAGGVLAFLGIVRFLFVRNWGKKA
jgi:hypothetical protein